MAKINFYLTGFYLVFIIINVKKTTWLEVGNGSGLFNPARPDPKFDGARPSRAGLAHVWGARPFLQEDRSRLKGRDHRWSF